MTTLFYFIMKTIEEQLDKLGIEYRINMEKDKDNRFPELAVALCDLFNCVTEINELQEKFPIILLLKSFYDAGFYRGLNYGIDSMENHVVEDSDLMVKYADEINQEILESVKSDIGDKLY